jgi:hydroxyacylglutathione hydrolase
MDHAGGAAELQRLTGVPIEGPHQDDQFWIDQHPGEGEMYGVPEARIFVTDRWLDDGDVVTLGETQFEVLHCPATRRATSSSSTARRASPRSGTYCSRARSAAPTSRAATTRTCWTPSPASSGRWATTSSSCPGHGPMSTFGAERRSNPFVSDLAIEAMNVEGKDYEAPVNRSPG